MTVLGVVADPEMPMAGSDYYLRHDKFYDAWLHAWTVSGVYGRSLGIPPLPIPVMHKYGYAFWDVPPYLRLHYS